MRYVLLCIGLILLLIGCGKSTSTAPSDFTITAPSNSTEEYANPLNTTSGSINYTLPFLVKDASGKPRNGIKVKFYLVNGTLYSDETFLTAVATPYEVETNDDGVAKAFVKVIHPACDATTDTKFTVTLTGSLQITGATWTDTVTVKKCGT